jgi:hypothetical protein
MHQPCHPGFLGFPLYRLYRHCLHYLHYLLYQPYLRYRRYLPYLYCLCPPTGQHPVRQLCRPVCLTVHLAVNRLVHQPGIRPAHRNPRSIRTVNPPIPAYSHCCRCHHCCCRCRVVA